MDQAQPNSVKLKHIESNMWAFVQDGTNAILQFSDTGRCTFETRGDAIEHAREHGLAVHSTEHYLYIPEETVQ